MAPCVIDTNTKSGKDAMQALNLANIKKAIPEELFEKSAWKSSAYMIRDYACWGSSVYGMYQLCNSSLWATMPFWQQAAVSILYWNVAGFFMWCVFMIGHDCGHTTFSESETVNDVFGHLTHGSLLVPFYPWQLSHRRHHMYHNHEKKDYSHPWYTPERLAAPECGMARMLHESKLLLGVFPFYGWMLYLSGSPDGCHLYPFEKDRMWRESDATEKRKCLISAAWVAVNLAAIIYFCGSLPTFAFYYFGPYIMFGWWLVTVTYLQHHDHDTVVYGDNDWNFVLAAFETVDRTYGFGIDDIQHNISNGHVVHHLFFTKIPHYNLITATTALRKYLAENNLEYLYKHRDSRDFFVRVHQYFLDFGFKAKRAGQKDKKQN